jgi:hypothetical protein
VFLFKVIPLNMMHHPNNGFKPGRSQQILFQQVRHQAMVYLGIAGTVDSQEQELVGIPDIQGLDFQGTVDSQEQELVGIQDFQGTVDRGEELVGIQGTVDQELVGIQDFQGTVDQELVDIQDFQDTQVTAGSQVSVGSQGPV